MTTNDHEADKATGQMFDRESDNDAVGSLFAGRPAAGSPESRVRSAIKQLELAASDDRVDAVNAAVFEELAAELERRVSYVPGGRCDD